MPSTTPKFAFPYPVGTDRVTDGDNAIQALAERVETILGTTRVSVVTKGPVSAGFKSTVWFPLAQNAGTLTLSAAGLVLVKGATDISAMGGSGFVQQRLNTDDATVATWYDPITRGEFVSFGLYYLPAGATVFTPQVQTFQNSAAGITISATRWQAHAFGGTPVWS